jgi:hypothetical protein
MSKSYKELPKRSKGAWVVHHGKKTSATINGAGEFPALDIAGKAASLLSQLAASEQSSIAKTRVEALARAAGLNPKLELPPLLDLLEKQRVIQVSKTGDVEALGLTSGSIVQHAADIFDDQTPTSEEQASIAFAELSSNAPTPSYVAQEYIGDEFKLSKKKAENFLIRTETVGFVDAEGRGVDKLYFNGNLFRRSNLEKTKKVLDSLTSADSKKVLELDERIATTGCLSVAETETVLGKALFEKLMAAGMYDVNHVANPSGEFGFVTRPSAFHKFNDPMVDDAFDLAKALVAALTYGMTQSSPGRGQIAMIGALLRKLINGYSVGPATAIGEDYKVLELRGVISVWPESYGYRMKLNKKDVGEMALKVLTTGEAAAANAIDRPFPGKMTDYSGPEKVRSDFRRKQTAPSKQMTQDVLDALRTRGTV